LDVDPYRAREAARLEHFPAKWQPVRRRKCEQLERDDFDFDLSLSSSVSCRGIQSSRGAFAGTADKQSRVAFFTHASENCFRAFSGEVATGSPQKMRLPKENQSEFRFYRNGIRFSGTRATALQRPSEAFEPRSR
jgi:hypothetical protein